MRQDRLEDADALLDPALRGWIVKTAKKNFWRVADWYEFDDLIQDGYLVFAKCRARYKPGRASGKAVPDADDRRQFMAFFQRAFQNHITDLANSHTETPEAAMTALNEAQAYKAESWTESLADLGDANFAHMLARAPVEILDMLKQIVVEGVADQPYKKTKLRKRHYTSGAMPRMVRARRWKRETTAEHFDRCLGKEGVVAKLQDYFLGQSAEKSTS